MAILIITILIVQRIKDPGAATHHQPKGSRHAPSSRDSPQASSGSNSNANGQVGQQSSALAADLDALAALTLSSAGAQGPEENGERVPLEFSEGQVKIEEHAVVDPFDGASSSASRLVLDRSDSGLEASQEAELSLSNHRHVRDENVGRLPVAGAIVEIEDAR